MSVLVASDAVGMGLNLAISRVVFSAVEKFDGKEERPLHKSEILQIGGRAGRFGMASNHENRGGVVTTLHAADLGAVRDAFQGKLDALETACLRPELSALEDFAQQMKAMYWQKYAEDVPLAEVLEMYEELHEADSGSFYLGDSMVDLAENAQALQDVGLPLSELFVFCMAPVDLDSAVQRAAYVKMALAFASERKVFLLKTVATETRVPATPGKLKEVECAHQCLELYVWLALRFSANFPDRALATSLIQKSSALIQAGLQQMTRAGMPVEAKQQRRRKGTQDLDADTPRDPRKVTRKARRSDKLRLRELLKEMRVPLHAREAT